MISVVFLRILRDNEFSYRILEHLALTHYAVKGVLTLTLIQYMLSWYSADELAFRFLLWNLVSPRLFDIVDVMDHQYTTNAILIFINIVVLNYLASLKFSDLIGVPKDVIWLTLHQKIYYTRRAAARIYFSNTSGFRGQDFQVGHILHSLTTLLIYWPAMDHRGFASSTGLWYIFTQFLELPRQYTRRIRPKGQ